MTAQPFVGRERELSELTGALEKALSRRGRLSLLSGEPGIGKTRLAKELADLAARRGARVLWGRAWEGGGQPAYWPWVQILRAYVRSEDPAVVAAELGGGAPYIRQLVPELPAPVPAPRDGPAAAYLDSDLARFYLFEAVGEFLRNAAARRPLVLVLDDLHAADLPSLLLLQFLAAEFDETRILAIGTYREPEARRAPEVGSLLADLARGGHIAIGGLPERDIARLIEKSVGIAPSSELVSAVHRVTEGNPFFADEIVRLLAADGRLQSKDALGAKLRLPDGVREVIRQRLAPLPEKCHELLTVAAVAGREFDARLLEAVSDRPLDQVTQVLDDAVVSGIVEPATSASGHFRFCHALIRDALYEDISTVRRQRLHRQIGEILERRYSDCTEGHLAELAHHYYQAAGTGVAEKAVDYAVGAGRRAMGQLAYEEAVGNFELALQALDLVAEPGEDQRCELLLALGAAKGAAGDRAKSQGAFVEAAHAARAAGDAEKLAEAALGLGRQSAFDEVFEARGNVHGRLAPLLEDALDALPVEDSPLRARLLSRLAAALFWKPGSRERMRSLVRAAVAMAERLGDNGVLAEALSHKRMTLLGPTDAAERLSDATRVLRLAAKTGDRQRELHAREARLYDLLERGDVAAAEVESEWIERLARALRQPRYLADAEMIRAMRTVMEGKLAEGTAIAERALALNQQVRPEIAVTLYGSQMLRVWREKGQLAELETGIKAVLNQEGPMRGVTSGLAFVRSEQGDREAARAEFECLAAEDFADIPSELAWTSVMANLAEVCCFLDDQPRARLLYGELVPFAALNVVLGPVPHACSGPIAHFLGMLAATLGETKQAAAHFESALKMETKMRMPVMRARTQYEYGRMLSRSDRPDETGRGARLLAAALEAAVPLGMKVLEREVGALLAEVARQSASVADARTGTQDSSRNLFRREGDYWAIAYEGRTFHLRDTRGLAYLAELLRAPTREFFALDLVRLSEAHVGGDARLVDDAAAVERARQSVTIAIRAALRKISARSPALGRHLASTVHTGKFCAYEPDPGSAAWRV